MAKAEFIGRDCKLAHVEVSPDLHQEGEPVGHVQIDNSIDPVVTQLLELLPSSEFTSDLEALLRDAWRPGRSYGEAFARLMTALLGKHGLVLLDPLNSKLSAGRAALCKGALRGPRR